MTKQAHLPYKYINFLTKCEDGDTDGDNNDGNNDNVATDDGDDDDGDNERYDDGGDGHDDDIGDDDDDGDKLRRTCVRRCLFGGIVWLGCCGKGSLHYLLNTQYCVSV